MYLFWAMQLHQMWAMHQSEQNVRQETDQSSARDKTQDVLEYTRAMDERFEHLALKCQALWELIRDNTKLTDEDIENKIGEVDLRDGVSDGKMTKVPLPCPSCGRTVSPRHSNCLYCGDVLPAREIFDQ